MLLRPLSYPNSEELVALTQTAPGAAGLATFSSGLPLSGSMYFTYAEQNRSFQALGVWIPLVNNVTGLAEPEQVRAIIVSDGTLQALSVQPILGRWLAQADQKPGGPERVMLSYGYWQRRFGGDKSVIGRSITVESRPREIVGVMPAGFRFADADPELIVPARFDRSRQILAGFGFQGIARLKPGVTIAQANADIARMLPIWMNSWSNGPGTNSRVYETWRITPALRPLKQAGDRQRGQCAVGGHGDHRHRDADRLRQRGEPVAGASGGAAAGTRHSRRARRGMGAHRSRAAARKRAARAAWEARWG